ncbi:MAG: sulfatase-like hydrolase/transferase [Halioglobus sp.]|nr:sulfatase-like hydrolase/transferase [Halioglobus sp.]
MQALMLAFIIRYWKNPRVSLCLVHALHCTMLGTGGLTLLLPASLGMAASAESLSEDEVKRATPNIVLLLFDDVGLSDLSPFGGEIDTPNIAGIAASGSIVTHFYSAARCSPTRAGMLSGRYPHDVGMADLANGPVFKTPFKAYQGQLPASLPLLSELLQAAGYETYMQGKWHLGNAAGMDTDTNPVLSANLRGFDHVYGFHGGQANPYPRSRHRHAYHYNGTPIEVWQGWYSVYGLNSMLLQQLTHQMQGDNDRPFFIYFSAQAAHSPQGAPQGLIAKYRKVYAEPLLSIWDKRLANMREKGLFPATASARHPKAKTPWAALTERAAMRAAMIEATDISFGLLLERLEQAGELDNTLIVVTSDNGASPGLGLGGVTNAPLRGVKGTLYEGGIRVPLIVSWPAGGIGDNSITRGVATFLDLMPTFLSAAGIDYPRRDIEGTPLQVLPGRNLLPMLRAGSITPPDFMYWNLYGQFAVLHGGRWKLLGNPVYDESAERADAEPLLLLFDLQSDPAEMREMGAKDPARVRQLFSRYKRWADQSGAVPYYKVIDAYDENRQRGRLN